MKRISTKRFFQVSFLILIVITFFIVNIYISEKRKAEQEEAAYLEANTYTTSNEFLRTVDCSDMFNEYQGYTFILSFDACSKIEGDVLVYMQNGTTARYSFKNTVHLSTEMRHYEIEISPILSDSNVTESYLAFYGTYGTGVIPTVRLINIEPKC